MNTSLNTSLNRARMLAGCYAVVSLATLGVTIALRDDSSAVNAAVWIRGGAVAISSLFTLLFAHRAALGSAPALRRLQIISTAMLVAVVVIISLPGTFPLWLKAEQGVCGAMLAGLVILTRRSNCATAC